VDEPQLLWTACAGVLREQVSEAVWLSSFANITALSDDGSQLVLSVPSHWVKERIESRYLEMVRAALADVGAPRTDLLIEIRPDIAELGPVADDPLDGLGFPREDQDPAGRTTGRQGNGSRTNGAEIVDHPLRERTSDTLNPKYTFDAFVIGSSNRFAHAAALTVAERPGLAYNPLFVYGDAGLGKTHLLQAIGHYVHENYRGYRVRYVSSETFLNEFVDSIRTGVGDSFKRRYRGVDVLMVDDIQFLERGKETLEEFFHTFNALHETGRQIVLSSDRRPDDLPALEDRLRTRFKAGLVTDIQPPDLETRLAIVRKKSESHPAQISDAVLEYIATHITDNIRELEGALTRVSAYASLYNEPMSVESAERVLRDLLDDRQPRIITTERILEATTKMFGLSRDELLSSSRTRPLVNARQIAMYVCRELTDLSFPQIAKAFGKSDHTTVIHAVQKIERQMGEKRQIYDQVNELTQLIRNAT
jgi:chromosomal replication initiator protein